MIGVSVSNYRCFDRAHPARFTVGPGLTAFVGPNNSGKSSLLRMFYELRSVIGMAVGDHIATGARATPQLAGIEDYSEIFSNQNEGPVEIVLSPSDSESQLPTVRFSSARPDGGVWAMHPKWPSGTVSADRLASAREAVAPLTDTLYVGPFRNVLNEGETRYYDLSIGTDFVRQWDSWKNGKNKGAARGAQHVEDDIRRIFGFRRLAINPSEDRKTLQLFVDDEPYRLGEVGAGMAQFIVVFASAAVRRTAYILIDEPELNLHPSLQVDFLLSLAQYSRVGVLFATHSIGLARSVAERIYSLRPVSPGVEVRQLEATSSYAEFAGEMSFSSFRELGFDQLLLVEGVTEVKVAQQILRIYQKEHKVLVIPLGGSALINGRTEQELAELRRITPHISVLIDSERASEGEALAEDRAAFLSVCDRLNFRAHATRRRATENYFTAQALGMALGSPRRVLKPFERLKEHEVGWSKVDNWRIASQMSKEDFDETDLGPFFAAI